MKMLLTILYCFALTLIYFIGFIIIYYNYSFSYWKSRGIPHLPPKFPFGNVASNVTTFAGQITADIYHKLKQNGHQYGGIYVFASPVFMPISPEVTKLVLMKNFHQFQDHGDLKKDKMAANIFTLSGNDWKQMRATLGPAFAPSRIKMMFPLLTEFCEAFDEILMDMTRKGESLDIIEFSGRYTTDVIGSCAFGIKCNCMQNPDAEFRRYGKIALGQNFLNLLRLRLALTAPAICRMFGINMWPPEATDFFQKVVHETITYREENNIQRTDLLDILIRLKKKGNTGDNTKELELDNIQIAAQAFVFFIAGFETSSKISTYCLCELGDNLEIQNKVRKELLEVLKEDGGVLTYDGVMKMKYLDKVIYETMRKYPIVLMVDRICTENFQIPETNITVEKGTRTLISTLGLHWDREYYPNPEIFDPQRFTEEEISKRPAYTYLPFGEGPRICPGAKFGMLQVKVFLAMMLKNYQYTLHPSVKMPIKTFSLSNLSHPIDNLILNIERI